MSEEEYLCEANYNESYISPDVLEEQELINNSDILTFIACGLVFTCFYIWI